MEGNKEEESGNTGTAFKRLISTAVRESCIT